MFLNQAYKKEVKYLRLKVWTFCAFNLFQKNNRKRDKTMNDEKKIADIYIRVSTHTLKSEKKFKKQI